MSELSANIKLRPVRVGLLVRPTDSKSVRRFMQVCTCLWGGMYNPIIPVFRNAPSEWRSEPWERVRGYRIAEGYIEFFEPDAFVETECGLSRLAGLEKRWDEYRCESRILPLDKLLACTDYSYRAEPHFGLSVVDPLQDIYDTEQRFKLRDKRTAYLVSPDQNSSAVEALFGSYPTEETSRYFSLAFEQVYQPALVSSSIEIWRNVFLRGAVTPLRATKHGIKIEQFRGGNLVIYVFDSNRTTDLIDLWNLRIESLLVLPVPQDWLPNLAEDLAKIIEDQHQQVVGDAKRIMHHTTIEFARSISQAEIKEMTKLIDDQLKSKSLSIQSIRTFGVKTWRNQVWVNNNDKHSTRYSRIELIAAERRASVPLQLNHRPYIEYESLAPEFARRYARSELRWINTVRLSNYTNANVATVLPFHTYSRRWPSISLFEPVLIGSEGWSIGEKFKRNSQRLRLCSQEEAVIGSLGVLGIKAELSEPGQIAKQIVEHLGGLRSVQLLANLDTLLLLNKMTRGDRRWASIGDWKEVLSRRAKNSIWPEIALERFTNPGIIRLGVVSSCPHCKVPNWHSLTNVDYELNCERCRKAYSFPQASLEGRNRNWAYRVFGPFSTRDYARGSYSALLALNTIRSAVSNSDDITYSTALSMSFDGLSYEVDFVVWHSRGTIVGQNSKPVLVIGEAKSLGQGDLIQDIDVERMKKIGSKLPGSIIAISVLRDHFSNSEQTRLRKLVRWGRRLNDKGEATNPVLLLTQTELLLEDSFHYAWEGKDRAYTKFANQYIEDLTSVADATVNIYLGLPTFQEQRRQALERRYYQSSQTQ